jgi:glyoxylase-like metal-dependent hydrolase (beta-lactamase superfamily II)
MGRVPPAACHDDRRGTVVKTIRHRSVQPRVIYEGSPPSLPAETLEAGSRAKPRVRPNRLQLFFVSDGPPTTGVAPSTCFSRMPVPGKQTPEMRLLGDVLAGVLAAVLGACRTVAAPPAQPFSIESVAPGDYVHFGQIAMTTPENAGDIANLGIIIGRDAVAVVDTGGSVEVGQELSAAVHRLTDRPVRYVINTHEHPDHIFGNAAFAQANAIFVGHHNLPRELAERGEYYIRSYRAALGEGAIAKVRIIPPSLLVNDETTLNLSGRRLSLTACSPAAHTDCDLIVLDRSTGTLHAGDLVFLDHVPVIDGSIRDERRYLSTIASDARRLILAGVPLAAAVPQIGASERDLWRLFDHYNPRNATVAFTELEWE